MNKETKISVRKLVEFILREGDLDNTRGSGVKDADAMQEGSRIHRKIQKSMPKNYRAEVSLSETFALQIPSVWEELSDAPTQTVSSVTIPPPTELNLTVEGRADGILVEPDRVMIDEIKGVYRDLDHLLEPVGVHLAQAKCYAYLYLYAGKPKTDSTQIDIQMTYCNLETERIKYFNSTWQYEELEAWFLSLIEEYGRWIAWEQAHQETRNESIRGLAFPFAYRSGQKDLAAGVYRTILRRKKLFIEAPTGVGKTISTVYPAVKAMGEGLSEKLFYLTAKTIARTVAERTMELLADRGLQTIAVTITSKEKLCILERPDCNPGACERAKGHFDRVNTAVFDLLVHESRIDRETILTYAGKHQVCPFEMCLDTATWADMVIGDYNYVFDPNVYLKRFFEGNGGDYIFLVDEAHNLVDRAREMYSAVLIKEDFLAVKRLVAGRSRLLADRLETCNRDLLHYKRECEEAMLIPYMTEFPEHLQRALGVYEEFLEEHRTFDGREQVLDLYFHIRHFLNMFELLDEKYQIYAEHQENGSFALHLQCMDPSTNLAQCLKKGRSTVFFSATLLPIRYYKEQLGGEEEDYAVYAPSPFQKEKRLILIGRDVSTRYTRRNWEEYERIAEYLVTMMLAKTGNYMAFFPSYQYMETMLPLIERAIGIHCLHPERIQILIQKSGMEELEREEFLAAFASNTEKTLLGCCVMGGIFSEGIDLTGEQLIGAAIVGTGIPMVCRERELFREYYEETKQAGFAYAYLYGGMNKVLQSAGRVIRTTEDRGVILLLDDRFLRDDHQSLFPREWYPYEVVTAPELSEKLDRFWSEENTKVRE